MSVGNTVTTERIMGVVSVGGVLEWTIRDWNRTNKAILTLVFMVIELSVKK